MAHSPKWRRYLRLFGWDVGADVDDELSFHLEAKTRELMERGLPLPDARREAMRHFGDVGEVSALCQRISKEHSRKMALKDRAGAWWYDTRHAFRSLRRGPGFACIAVATLAAGISGTTALFSLVDAWVIRALRFPEPQQLIFAQSLDARRGREISTSFADYVDLVARARQFQTLAAWSGDYFTLMMENAPERIAGSRVSTNFFDALGARPMLGRGFLPAEGEYGRHRVVVVSYGFWKTRLNGSPSAIGSRIDLDGAPHLVVGVMPERFQFIPSGRRSMWVPLSPEPADRIRRQVRDLALVGRLKPGVTAARARAELSGIAGQLAAAYPDTNRDVGAFCIPLRAEIGRQVGDSLILSIFAITLGLLLIAASNVANLLLVRALGRKRQGAIQLALGASRGRLMRQSAIETLVVFAASAAAGTLGAVWFTRLLVSFIPYRNRGYIPDYGDASVNWTVLAFVLAITLVTGLAFGMIPALEAARANVVGVLKESGSAVSQSPRTRRMRLVLVTAQVVMAAVTLSSTAVIIGAFRGIWSGPMGFDGTGVLTLRLSLAERDYPDAARRRIFFETLADRLGQAAIADSVPFSYQSAVTAFRVPGVESPDEARALPRAAFNAVSPGYFAVMKTPLLAGRAFERGDSQDAPLKAIVNDAFVAQFLKGKSAIGQPVVLGRAGNRSAEIVGVVAEIRERNDQLKGNPQVYVPFAQVPGGDQYLIVRASHDPMALLPEIRRRAAELDGRQPVYDAETLDNRVSDGTAPFRVVTGMLAWFGFLTLVLAAIGVYGVVAFSVSQRTREIGIRAALGADRGSLQRLFLRQGGWILAAGLAPGLACGFGAAIVLRSLSNEVAQASLVGPIVFTAALLGLVVLAATALPARRAAAVDPLAAIRYE